MKSERGIRQSLFVCGAVLIASVLAIAPSAFAQKKGGGGGSAGTIYFINGSSVPPMNANYTWSMDANGANRTLLVQYGYLQFPSRALHNGHRWFVTQLQLPGLFYPDGVTVRKEVFAIRDDYDPANPTDSETRVQLTDDATLQPGFIWWKGMQWLPGDQSISYMARRWSGIGSEISEGGLYKADLEFRADGNIIGLASPPTTPTLVFPLTPFASGMWPTLQMHSWNPDGSQVAYTESPATGLWVANLSTGTRTNIQASGDHPDWASNGSKILFSNGAIYTIKPDGTGRKTILTSNYTYSGFGHPYFSPDAAYITCVGISRVASSDGMVNDVLRATASGGSLTNLTNTGNMNEIPIGWR